MCSLSCGARINLKSQDISQIDRNIAETTRDLVTLWLELCVRIFLTLLNFYQKVSSLYECGYEDKHENCLIN